MANNKTKANRDSPVVAVVAPTTTAVKTDSTEATAMVAGTTKAASQPSMVVVAVIPPKALQPLSPHSSTSTIGTIAILMVATSIITTQVPPVHNPVSITNVQPPDPTLWAVTTSGYIKPFY
jgi:hypothetical protein